MQAVKQDTAHVVSENVELVRALTDAANRIDIDALIALLSPDVVWEETTDLPGLREAYRGREEVRKAKQGKITRRQVFWHRDDALRAAGLRE